MRVGFWHVRLRSSAAIPPANASLLGSIQTWALEEARRRLEAEGILEDKSGKA